MLESIINDEVSLYAHILNDRIVYLHVINGDICNHPFVFDTVNYKKISKQDAIFYMLGHRFVGVIPPVGADRGIIGLAEARELFKRLGCIHITLSKEDIPDGEFYG